MSGDSNPRGDSNALESEIALLKRIPSSHYTTYQRECVQVDKLIELLSIELEKSIVAEEKKSKTG